MGAWVLAEAEELQPPTGSETEKGIIGTSLSSEVARRLSLSETSPATLDPKGIETKADENDIAKGKMESTAKIPNPELRLDKGENCGK